MKQKNITGLYFRLSQEDERQGESASIEHQRTILRKYAEERGFEIHDKYIDYVFPAFVIRFISIQDNVDTENMIQSADEFIQNVKKYLEEPELTREMCYDS